MTTTVGGPGDIGLNPSPTLARTPRASWPRRAVTVVDPLGVLGLAAVVGLWWIGAWYGWVPALFLPAPVSVTDFITANFFSSPLIAAQNLGTGGLFANLLHTSTSVWFAVLLALVIAVPLGLSSARIAPVRMFSDPIVMTIGTIPVLVVMPFFIIWFGVSRWAQIGLLVLYSVPVVYVYAQRAVRNLDPVYVSNALVLGVPRSRILREVYLRGTLPEVVGGIRIALAGSWGLGAIAETLGAPAGVGKLIVSFASNTNSVGIFASVLVLACCAILTDLLVAALFRLSNRWRASR